MFIFHRTENNCMYFVKFYSQVLLILQYYLEVYIIAMLLTYTQIKIYQ